MAEPSLRADRLILRPPAYEDLPWLLEAINTPAVMRHLGREVHSESEVAESLAEDIAAFASPRGHRRWTVLLANSGERVGRCGLFHVRSEAAPPPLRGKREIGWMFAEAHWRKGYATESAQAVLDWAFASLRVGLVYSQTSESNAASTRMMSRLGLTCRNDLDYVDPDYPPADNPTTVWSVTAEQWARCRG